MSHERPARIKERLTDMPGALGGVYAALMWHIYPQPHTGMLTCVHVCCACCAIAARPAELPGSASGSEDEEEGEEGSSSEASKVGCGGD